jgi:predicted flap endonuclease-1-like 5' DNA nuclease
VLLQDVWDLLQKPIQADSAGSTHPIQTLPLALHPTALWQTGGQLLALVVARGGAMMRAAACGVAVNPSAAPVACTPMSLRASLGLLASRPHVHTRLSAWEQRRGLAAQAHAADGHGPPAYTASGSPEPQAATATSMSAAQRSTTLRGTPRRSTSKALRQAMHGRMTPVQQMGDRVSVLPGIGPKYERLLQDHSIRTVNDLMRTHMEVYASDADATFDFLKVRRAAEYRFICSEVCGAGCTSVIRGFKLHNLLQH